ncbi:unnamed protein product [Protopolystoma xenopodis]|uniref:Uncharacterized protein n=1 Tax=Protopolystoma xenopodis TaxID=117903 RepID=A0A448WUA1_9PLAT|nr:unnamed protein product [Protopolystoma xenopodis]
MNKFAKTSCDDVKSEPDVDEASQPRKVFSSGHNTPPPSGHHSSKRSNTPLAASPLSGKSASGTRPNSRTAAASPVGSMSSLSGSDKQLQNGSMTDIKGAGLPLFRHICSHRAHFCVCLPISIFTFFHADGLHSFQNWVILHFIR